MTTLRHICCPSLKYLVSKKPLINGLNAMYFLRNLTTNWC
jgi:hypothetical protein